MLARLPHDAQPSSFQTRTPEKDECSASGGPDLQARATRREVVLGGCMVWGDEQGQARGRPRKGKMTTIVIGPDFTRMRDERGEVVVDDSANGVHGRSADAGGQERCPMSVYTAGFATVGPSTPGASV